MDGSIGIMIVTLLSTILLSKSVTRYRTLQEREEFSLAKCAIFAIGGVTFVRYLEKIKEIQGDLWGLTLCFVHLNLEIADLTI